MRRALCICVLSRLCSHMGALVRAISYACATWRRFTQACPICTLMCHSSSLSGAWRGYLLCSSNSVVTLGVQQVSSTVVVKRQCLSKVLHWGVRLIRWYLQCVHASRSPFDCAGSQNLVGRGVCLRLRSRCGAARIFGHGRNRRW